MRERTTTLAATLAALALALVAVAVLGPLMTGVIAYRYSETMLNQAVGLDLFAVAVVAPLALLAAALSWRGHRAGPLLALAPAGFAAYMSVQYVVGPEYLLVAGNGERAFPLFAGLFVLSAVVLAQAWSLAAEPAGAAHRRRRRGLGLLALAAFVVLGMYVANGFLSALSDFPSYVGGRSETEYDEHPTAYWVVAWLDLAVVVPLTVATGVGLLRGRGWADRAFYGVIGWYALVPGSVASMALVMVARDDPAADAPRAVMFTVVAVALLALASRVLVPLLHDDSPARQPSRTG